ncbi:MAG: DUF1499 domain-containing protein [Pikeienuella sp.]
MFYALCLLILMAVGLMAYIRMAPDDPERWHVDPAGVQATKALNDFVVAPSGGDMVSPVYDMSPEALMTAFQRMALSQPRTSLLGERDGFATYIQRTAKMAYPDYISVRAVEAAGGAQLYVYSRSRYGLRDFDVNKKRVLAWLKKL